jgi:LysM repeat protein
MAHWLAFAGPSPATHDVHRGESLWSIARAHGTTVEALRAANPELAEPLQAGARLRLPRATPTKRPSPPSTSAPTAKAAAARQAVAAADEAAAVAKSASKARGAASKRGLPRTHVVVRGDTLEAIAREHATTVAALQEMNHMRSTKIVVGQRLLLEPPFDVDGPDAALPEPPRGSFDLPPPPGDDARPRDTTKSRSDVPPPPPLVGAVQLPRDKAYYLRHPKRAWGLPHVVESTRAAVVAVKKQHPGVHRLAIGDISAERGGRLSGHKSHRSGRDVDVGLYFRRTPASYPQKFVGAGVAPLDLAATWSLIEAFYEQSKKPGGPVQIFLDFEVQGRIYEWARGKGVSRRVLREVFQFPHGRWARRGLVRHEPAHDDHLHVRYGEPPKARRPKP